MKSILTIYVFVITAIYFFYPGSLLARSYNNQSWEVLFSANELVDFNEFVSSDYVKVFWSKLAKTQADKNFDEKYLSAFQHMKPEKIYEFAANEPFENRVYIYGGFLGFWHPFHTKNRMAGPGEKINGYSKKFGLVSLPIESNDYYFKLEANKSLPVKIYKTTLSECLIKKINFNLPNAKNDIIFTIGGYNTATNLLQIDPRFKLPPIIWMTIMNHEIRHSYDDIVTFKNRPLISKNGKFNDEIRDFEIQGYLMSTITWKMAKEMFVKSWKQSNLDNRKEYASTKLIVNEACIVEEIVDDYMGGQKKPLEAYACNIFLKKH